jgi:serine/threonine protein kinase
VEALTPLETGDPEQVGHYRIVGRLGQGGMGRVYLGRLPSGRAVAVKVVREELAEDTGFRRRFAREVKAARRVAGIFTAAVVDDDREGTQPWLATEYVPGMSLDVAVAEHGTWPERSLRALGSALAEALGAIHRAEVVHRDLKPSNVLLAADGPRVIDFGISVAAEDTKLTQTGVVIGTPGFIAPEQLLGHQVGPACDIFALGAILAYAATGAGPFGSGSPYALNYRVVHEEPDLAGLPDALTELVSRCLAKDPGQRPTVPELVEELGQASHARSTGPLADADWLPEPVAAELARQQNGVQSTPTNPNGTGSGSERSLARRLVRRPILASAAIVALLAAIVTPIVVVNGESSNDESSNSDSGTEVPELEKAWSYRPEREVSTSPAVADDTVFFCDANGTLYAVEARSGDLLWQYREVGDSAEVTPVVSDGVAFFLSEDEESGVDSLYAVDVDTGRGLWESEIGSYLTPQLAAADGIVYYYSYEDYSLHAVEAETGEEVWDQEFEYMIDTLVASSNAIYATDGDTLFALDANSGHRLWDYGNFDDDPSIIEISDGRLYLGVATDETDTDGEYLLSALDAITGTEIWSKTIVVDGSMEASLTVANELVYIGVGNDMYALRTDVGDQIWKRTVSEPTALLPLTVEGGVVYLQGDSGTLFALEASNGRCLWACAPRRIGTGQESRSPVLIDGHVYFSNTHMHAADVPFEADQG